jgi:hypothetical protein
MKLQQARQYALSLPRSGRARAAESARQGPNQFVAVSFGFGP